MVPIHAKLGLPPLSIRKSYLLPCLVSSRSAQKCYNWLCVALLLLKKKCFLFSMIPSVMMVWRWRMVIRSNYRLVFLLQSKSTHRAYCFSDTMFPPMDGSLPFFYLKLSSQSYLLFIYQVGCQMVNKCLNLKNDVNIICRYDTRFKQLPFDSSTPLNDWNKQGVLLVLGKQMGNNYFWLYDQVGIVRNMTSFIKICKLEIPIQVLTWITTSTTPTYPNTTTTLYHFVL